jgi:biopolymer transport protein ExbD
MGRKHLSGAIVGLLGLSLLAACEETKKPKPVVPTTVTEPEVVKAPSRPKGPPELAVDEVSPKVGYDRAPLNKEQDVERLRALVAESKEFISGKDVELKVDRHANLKWVIEMIDAMAAIDVGKIKLSTPTRPDYPVSLTFIAQSKVSGAPGCSLVTTVLKDRGTAVWRLQGGTALKRGKGLGGPDLSMTGETIEKVAKGCKDSDWLFVRGADEIEWGLIYDLAASAHVLEKAKFGRVVLLREEPVAGRAVELAK